MLLSGAAALSLTACSGTDGFGNDNNIYSPGVWVDPDGCEHYILDDGFEGYMSPHLTRDGKPVCRNITACGTINTDQLFATDSARINTAGQGRLRSFFGQVGANGVIIVGHTDSRASDEYNLNLSLRRARAVAAIAQSSGVRVVDVRGSGERNPVATNATAQGRQKNRRVDVYCASAVPGASE